MFSTCYFLLSTLPALGQAINIPDRLTKLRDVTITTPSNGQALIYNGSVWVNTGISSGLTIGTTAITSGTTGRFLYDNGGVVGERTPAQVLSDIGAQASGSYAPLASPTFTGTVTLPASTAFTTPNIGAATGTSLAFSGGGILGGTSGALTLTASGTNQGFTFTPSGSGGYTFKGDSGGTKFAIDTFGAVSGFTTLAPNTGNNGAVMMQQSGSPNALSFINSAGLSWSSTSANNGTRDLGISRNAAGVAEVNNGTAGTYRDLKLRAIIPAGTDVTCTGGTIGTGSKNHAGFVTSTTTGTSTIVVTFTVTAPTGWSISASDSTAITNLVQTASSTTTATIVGTTVTGDVIRYIAMPF